MKKNLVYLIILAALLTVAYFVISKPEAQKKLESYANFAVEDTSLVQKIFISNNVNQETILLERKGSDWTLNGEYLAKRDRVDVLLKTFALAEVIYPVAQSEMETVIKTIAASNRKIMIYGPRDELIKTWYIGHSTQSKQGTYALLELPEEGKSDYPYIITVTGFTGHLVSRFDTNLEDWRNSKVFSYPELDIQEVDIFRPKELYNSFNIKINDFINRDFEVVNNDGIPIIHNPNTIATYVGGYKRINLESYRHNLSEMSVDSIMNSQPDYLISVKDSEGEVTSIKLYYKNPTRDLKLKGYDTDPERMIGVFRDEVVSFQRLTVNKLMALPSELQ